MKHLSARCGSLYLHLFALFCLQLGLSQPVVAEEQVIVIAHPSTPIDGVSMAELKQIFLGNKVFWPDGQRITLVVSSQRDSVTRKYLMEKLYGWSEAQYRRYWLAKAFRNENIRSPLSTSKPRLANALVRKIPGGVSLVPGPWATEGVKILAVDGVLPGRKNYKLRY